MAENEVPSQTQNSEEIRFYAQSGPVLREVLRSLLLVAVCGWVMYLGWYHAEDEFARGLVVCLGVVGILFFGGGLILLMHRQKTRTPLLTLRSEGIVETSSFPPIGLIPWEEIEAVVVFNTFSPGLIPITQVMGIVLKEPEKLYVRLPRLKAWLIAGNVHSNLPPVAFAPGLFGMSAGDLQKRIREYCASEGVGKHIRFDN